MRVVISEADLAELVDASVLLDTSGVVWVKHYWWCSTGEVSRLDAQLANGRPMVILFDAGKPEALLADLAVDAAARLQLTDFEALIALAEIDFINCWRRHHPVQEDSEESRLLREYGATKVKHPGEFVKLDGEFTGG